MMITTLLNYVNLLIQRDVQREINAEELTTEWKDSTIKTNIRLNSAIIFLTKFSSVSMESIVRLPTQSRT